MQAADSSSVSPSRVNINRPVFDEPRDYEGFRCLRARIGRQAGTEKIGLSLFELPPGQAAYPYHWHVGEEELVIILEGRPPLRTPDGWRELEPGEVLAFPVGERGAHQLVNRTQEPLRFLAFSNQQPDIIVRPDSATIGLAERRPEGGGLAYYFRIKDAIGYIEGERAP
jgi:uncharacterized cupin superfamily protein